MILNDLNLDNLDRWEFLQIIEIVILYYENMFGLKYDRCELLESNLHFNKFNQIDVKGGVSIEEKF